MRLRPITIRKEIVACLSHLQDTFDQEVMPRRVPDLFGTPPGLDFLAPEPPFSIDFDFFLLFMDNNFPIFFHCLFIVFLQNMEW